MLSFIEIWCMNLFVPCFHVVVLFETEVQIWGYSYCCEKQEDNDFQRKNNNFQRTPKQYSFVS